MRVLLPLTLDEIPTLPEGVEVARYDPTQPLLDDHLNAEVFVAWGNTNASLRDAAGRLTRLRWVASLAAGSDQILQSGFGDDVVLTSGIGLHNQPVAEHALALLLALVRELPAAAEAQRRHEWSPELGGTRPLHPADRLTTLLGARVLVWGFGSIAQTLAPLLTGLGATVTGVARHAGERAGYPVIAESDIDAHLPSADALVMILPSTPQTDGALSRERIALLPSGALVVNVGRGSTHDEGALVAALTEGRLGGVGLDVTSVEPLPADSPVWDTPRLILTPHAAGGRPVGWADLIAENCRRLLAGEVLANALAR